MNSRVRELRMEDLDALPSPCRGCVFWQSTAGGKGGRPSDPAAQDAWWRAVQLDWGVPGRAVWRQDSLIAFALFAPPAHVPRLRLLGPPPGEDVLVLAMLWVDPIHRRGGLARHLVQVIARDAVARGHKAIEVYAAVAPGDAAKAGACTVSPAFLEHVGFTLHRADPLHPLYRLDLERTARWQGSMADALGEVVAALSRRERKPAVPATESRTSLGPSRRRPGVWTEETRRP